MAKGEYLAVVDHDDISLPERFAKEVDVLDNNPDIGVVSAKIHEIYANKDIEEPETDTEIKIQLMRGCAILHPAAMIRKSVLVQNNIRYETDYSPSEDYKLWCQLINFTKFYNIQEVLLNYRDWEGNTTHKQGKKMTLATEMIFIENEVRYPELWQKYEEFYVENITIIRLFNIIPFIKIIEKRKKKYILLFNFIPLFSIKRKKKIKSKINIDAIKIKIC